MLNIVIVEDEIFFQEKIKKIIRTSLYNILDKVDIELYKSFTFELKSRINDLSKKTLYILDIELKNSVSGIEIAKKIRENDWNSEIIFLTHHDKMFEIVYRNVYKVFLFIEKFHDMENKLSKVIKLIATTKVDKKLFKYNARSINLQLYLKDIIYIYRDKNERKLLIKTTCNKFKINMALNEIIKYLDSRFILCHRACIVNKDRVVKYNWNIGNFILDTGETVDLLSKRYKDKVLTNEDL